MGRTQVANPKAVEIEFEIVEVKTMVDRSTTIKINLPEYCQDQALEIMRHVKELKKPLLSLQTNKNKK
jgi:hypothetical protein